MYMYIHACSVIHPDMTIVSGPGPFPSLTMNDHGEV